LILDVVISIPNHVVPNHHHRILQQQASSKRELEEEMDNTGEAKKMKKSTTLISAPYAPLANISTGPPSSKRRLFSRFLRTSSKASSESVDVEEVNAASSTRNKQNKTGATSASASTGAQPSAFTRVEGEGNKKMTRAQRFKLETKEKLEGIPIGDSLGYAVANVEYKLALSMWLTKI
jgi:hypothetical protein